MKTVKRNRESVVVKPRSYNTEGLPTRYFNPGELEALLHLFESVDAKVIVEFGVNTGRNPAAAFLNIPGIEKYVGVDVTPDYITQMQCQRKEIPAQPGHLAANDSRFELIVRPTGTFELTSDDLPRCDAVFVDADHSRAGVLNDRVLAQQIVRPGGIIIYHDDNEMTVVEVTETLNDLCDKGANIVHVAGTWIAYEVV